jgi:hypothetical protein
VEIDMEVMAIKRKKVVMQTVKDWKKDSLRRKGFLPS